MKNVFYFKVISSIGGVETFFYNLSQLYKDFTVVYKKGDPEQIKRLAQNVEVVKFEGQKIKCDRFFCNYAFDILGYVEAKEYYHIIHCDYSKVRFPPILNEGFKYIGVSKLACKSFKERVGIDAELIYNPVIVKKHKVEKYNDGKIHILCATRLSKEKGGENILKLAQMSDDFIIDVYSNRKLPYKLPNVIQHEPKLDLSEEMARSHYVAQLSKFEAFGLTPAEALTIGTPVIVTDIPAFREIGCIHGKNAVICDINMKNVDIDLIKKGLAPFKYEPPKEGWSKYLTTKSNYNPKEKIKVRTRKNYLDVELQEHFKRNTIIEDKITKERASYLEAKDIIERI